jgi:2-polyprenyl-3-methyl-5-hydroxy-6-metoxy-1,4-benzoquinol methylase
MQSNIVDDGRFPNLGKLVGQVLAIWPEHRRYLEKSIGARDAGLMQHSELLAGMVVRLAGSMSGGLPDLCADYRFLCEGIVLPEELHFRRHGTYRLTKFEDALRTVYSDRGFMTRYMTGLLASDVLWINHCQGLQHYAHNFLGGLRQGSSLLEIGPGHGLLLYLATRAAKVGQVTAWDISRASLDMAQHALDVLQAPRAARFEERNIFDPSILAPENGGAFDGVVLSEVLEHLETPEQAVRVLFHLCKPGGRVWINVPANSPAPDHLYLVSEPEQAKKLVSDAGFKIVDAANYPMTGATLERAVRQKLTITCIIVGERPA